jgi:predicted DNA-binding protein
VAATISKTFRIPRTLHRRLAALARAKHKNYAEAHRDVLERGLSQTEAIDMAAALSDFIGMGDGTGRTQVERMKKYGRRRTQHR